MAATTLGFSVEVKTFPSAGEKPRRMVLYVTDAAGSQIPRRATAATQAPARVRLIRSPPGQATEQP